MTEEEKLIRNMEVGESGWTMPWAVRLGLQNDFWIDLDYPICDEQLAASALQVTLEKEGYRTKLCGPYKYEPQRISAWDRYFTKRLKRLPKFERPT